MSTQQQRQEWRELAAYMCGLTVKAATYDTSAGFSVGVNTGFEASWDHATGRAIALETAIAATVAAVPALLADVDALTQERDALAAELATERAMMNMVPEYVRYLAAWRVGDGRFLVFNEWVAQQVAQPQAAHTPTLGTR